MQKLTKTQKMILRHNYEFALVLMTPAICAAIVALIPIIMYKP